MKYGFAKILGSQESGYSGDKPNQRGKYVLVPKTCLQAFPSLSERVLNDQTTLKCLLPNGNLIGLNVVYHNAKFFPSTHKRDHDEVRIYRNVEFENTLKADRGVLVVFIPIENEAIGSFSVFSLTANEPGFEQWKALDRKTFTSKDVERLPGYKEAIGRISEQNNTSLISNFEEVVQYVSNVAEKRSTTQRMQQEAAIDDPALPLSTLIGTQAQFAAYLRDMYDFKCCLRKESLLANKDALGLDAAHIQPHSHGGPLLPTNGILLSADLHRAFEFGAITLTTDCKIEVHRKVSESSSIMRFRDVDVTPRKYQVFKPFKSYIEFHRENIFARFMG